MASLRISRVLVRAISGNACQRNFSFVSFQRNFSLIKKPNQIQPTYKIAKDSCIYMRLQSFSQATQTKGESELAKILEEKFPGAVVKVNDISGGCGDMYEVHVTSNIFSGKRTVQQHRLVTEALKNEVAKMHGLRIFTST